MTMTESGTAIRWPDMSEVAGRVAQMRDRLNALYDEVQPLAREARALLVEAENASEAGPAALLDQLPEGCRDDNAVEGGLLTVFNHVTGALDLNAAMGNLSGLFDPDERGDR